jgi:hypothetical protein
MQIFSQGADNCRLFFAVCEGGADETLNGTDAGTRIIAYYIEDVYGNQMDFHFGQGVMRHYLCLQLYLRKWRSAA